MGNPRKLRKLYEKPKKLWDKHRIEEENALQQDFGLKNKRELWRMQTIIRKLRREVRRLLSKKGKDVEARTQRVLARVKRFLLNKQDATLDDLLNLTVRDILARRLQTVIVSKKMASTVRQARQYIVHGHVALEGRRITAPSYLVNFNEEDKLNWYKQPVNGTAAATVKA